MRAWNRARRATICWGRTRPASSPNATASTWRRVSETGWPYVQHRGGPRGFLRVIDDRTLGVRRFSRQPAIYQPRQSRRRRARLADPGGLREPRAAEDPRPCARLVGLDDDPKLAEADCDARLSRPGRTRIRAPSRCLRLELPAAHHAALHPGGARSRRRRRSTSASPNWKPNRGPGIS